MTIEPERSPSPKRIPRAPEPTAVERAEEAGRAAGRALASAALPVVGDTFAEFLASYFPSIRKRREAAWLEKLRDAVNYLRRHSLRIDDLRDNEEFHDIVCAATEAARRTHLDEKRQALRNAIVNAALPDAPSQMEQHMFVRLVDEFSELHLHLLQLLADPALWFEAHGMALPRHRGGTGIAFDRATSEARLEAVLCLAFPDYTAKIPFVMLVLGDLERRGLVQDQDQGVARALDATTFCAPIKTFLTPLGREFLRFIRTPAEPTA